MRLDLDRPVAVRGDTYLGSSESQVWACLLVAWMEFGRGCKLLFSDVGWDCRLSKCW